MVSARRPLSSQGTLLLDAFRADPVKCKTPSIHYAHANVADLDASLPAFAVLRTAGFVTALGCVCAAAVLRDGHDSPGVHVDLRRLELAGKALGKPLRRVELKALAATGLRVDEHSVVLDADLVGSQWNRLPKQGARYSKEAREKFATRYRRIVSGDELHEKCGVSTQLPWFGRPVAASAISEDSLAKLMSNLGLPYAAGRHYGVDWELLSGLQRHCEVDVNEEEHEALASSMALSFVLGRSVPSRPRRLNVQDNDDLYQLRGALTKGALPQRVLQVFPRDGRMLIVEGTHIQP